MNDITIYQAANIREFVKISEALENSGIPFAGEFEKGEICTAQIEGRNVKPQKCPECGEYHTAVDMIQPIDEQALCKKCAERLYERCPECGRYATRLHEVDGKTLCASCLESERYVRCHDCGQWTQEPKQAVNIYSLVNVCHDCFINHYERCDDCSTYADTRYMQTTIDGDRICIACYDDEYVHCCDCDCVVRRDDATYCEEDFYCPDCKPCIFDYSYKPEPLFLGMPGNGRYFGIELETDCGNSIEFAKEALNELDDEGHIFYFKRDGSLGDDGAELVTHPMSYEYAMGFDWERLHEIARKHGQLSHDTETCGLHIHVSRAGLGGSFKERELTTARLINVFDRYYNEIVEFARRQPQETRWCNRNNAGFEPDDTNEQLAKKMQKEREKYDRYQAVNIRNRDTVEIRIFHGTLNPDTIRATITFVNDLVEYCMKTENKNLTSNKKLFDQIQFSDNVVEYAKTRGLVD